MEFNLMSKHERHSDSNREDTVQEVYHLAHSYLIRKYRVKDVYSRDEIENVRREMKIICAFDVLYEVIDQAIALLETKVTFTMKTEV